MEVCQVSFGIWRVLVDRREGAGEGLVGCEDDQQDCLQCRRLGGVCLRGKPEGVDLPMIIFEHGSSSLCPGLLLVVSVVILVLISRGPTTTTSSQRPLGTTLETTERPSDWDAGTLSLRITRGGCLESSARTERESTRTGSKTNEEKS